MSLKNIFLGLIVTFTLFSEINDSIVPLIGVMAPDKLRGKVTKKQMRTIQKIEQKKNDKIRIMTFNMLFNLKHKEALLDVNYHWINRFPRIIEYLKFAKPDIIGTQELYKDQIDDLMSVISEKYAYYAVGKEDGKDKGETQAIFYDKKRFELIEGKVFYYSKFPLTPGFNSYRIKNTLTYCEFIDKNTNKKFIVLNTHLSFANVQARQYEAKFIKNFIDKLPSTSAIILTGDFNAFPMRFDLNLPFHDGAFVFETITKSTMEDSMNKSLLGHLGPIASTNVSNETKQPFSGNGTPGVILDFIFVNKNVFVRSHGIDPAKINNEYMSDHFPVLAEIILN